MSGLTVAYVLIPCIGAVLLGAVIRDWRLAAAAACGALGLLVLRDALPETLRVFGPPVLVGVALGAIALVPYLVKRPTADVWGRMIAALIPTFLLSFLFLLLNTSGS